MDLLVNLFVSAIASIRTIFKSFQMQRFLAVVLVGLVFFTATIDPQRNTTQQELTNKVQERLHENDDQRPKTTAEWMNEAKQDVPLNQRMEDIAEDSAEAFKEFGSGYVDGAKKTARQVQDGAADAGKELINQR
jgi:hypothetical protein